MCWLYRFLIWESVQSHLADFLLHSSITLVAAQRTPRAPQHIYDIHSIFTHTLFGLLPPSFNKMNQTILFKKRTLLHLFVKFFLEWAASDFYLVIKMLEKQTDCCTAFLPYEMTTTTMMMCECIIFLWDSICTCVTCTLHCSYQFGHNLLSYCLRVMH